MATTAGPPDGKRLADLRLRGRPAGPRRGDPPGFQDVVLLCGFQCEADVLLDQQHAQVTPVGQGGDGGLDRLDLLLVGRCELLEPDARLPFLLEQARADRAADR